MTCIAWDGKTLAADKRTTFGSLAAVTTKLHRIGGQLAAGCGNSALIQEMLQWLRDGANPLTFPAAQRSPTDCVSVLVIEPGQPLKQYESTPNPLVILNEYWAIGSGRDFALAAMFLGKTAREAVEVACALDTNCGNGIDTLEFDR